MSRLRTLRDAGQSVWLDFLSRPLITSGGLQRLIDDHEVSGVTSNPSIFARAMVASDDYDAALRALPAGDEDPLEDFYRLALSDIRMAADQLLPTWERSAGSDGFVSFELEPRLAHDAEASIDAALLLVDRIARPNVMIKVPGTAEGVAAVEQLTAAGVNINITLLFTVERYEAVAQAYLVGLERRLASGRSVGEIASVASFFVSRVDSALASLLPADSALRGRVAVANAKVAYQSFLRLFSGERWRRLAQAGARVQRPLWASTGTKDPSLSDVFYVEELVGPDTVTTVPDATLRAFLDHGEVRPRAVMERPEDAEVVLRRLGAQGIDLTALGAELEENGLAIFTRDLGQILDAIQVRRRAMNSPAVPVP